MAPTRRTVLGVTATTIGLAGCIGGSDSSGSPSPEETTPTDAMTTTEATTTTDGGTSSASVRVGDHPELGEILVDAERSTLYMFDPDERGAGASTCYDGCAETWPPLTTDGTPEPGDGVLAELTTFERDDGSTQVAADGWPLYYFAGDDAAGEANGQGINDVWWVLDPSGEPIRET